MTFYLKVVATCFLIMGSLFHTWAQPNARVKETIIYIWDPLCGWCYGFEPQMEKFQEEYKAKYNFEVVIGGMVIPPNGIAMREMRDFLTKAIPQLEKTTNVKIGQAYYDQILSNDSLIMTSLTPALVFNFLKPLYKGSEVTLANAIQKTLYEEGKNYNDLSSFKKLIEKSGYDFVDVSATIGSKSNKEATYAMFKRSRTLGITGYPAVLKANENGIRTLSRGYTTYQKLKNQL